MSEKISASGSEFQGLVAVITGGASGIGAATAELLATKGCRVAVVDVSASINDNYLSIACDITDQKQVELAIETIASKLGGIDILVNNAGIGSVGQVSDNPDPEWARVFDVNVFGGVRVTRAALPYLRKSEHPSVVFTGSVVAEIGVKNRALYSASKGAVEALTRAMAADLVVEGIRVNAVSPGTADTPWVARLIDAAADSEEARKQLTERQPMRRLVAPQEIAHAIAYLANPLSASTTGTILYVDGGMSSLRVG